MNVKYLDLFIKKSFKENITKVQNIILHFYLQKIQEFKI